MLLASRTDKIENLNNANSNNNNNDENNNLSENFALNKADDLHTTNFKSCMRFQQKNKSKIEIAKEKPKN